MTEGGCVKPAATLRTSVPPTATPNATATTARLSPSRLLGRRTSSMYSVDRSPVRRHHPSGNEWRRQPARAALVDRRHPQRPDPGTLLRSGRRQPEPSQVDQATDARPRRPRPTPQTRPARPLTTVTQRRQAKDSRREVASLPIHVALAVAAEGTCDILGLCAREGASSASPRAPSLRTAASKTC